MVARFMLFTKYWDALDYNSGINCETTNMFDYIDEVLVVVIADITKPRMYLGVPTKQII